MNAGLTAACRAPEHCSTRGLSAARAPTRVNVFTTFYSRSLLRLRLDKPADALADAQTAVRLDPSSANARLVEALSEEQLHHADAAARDAEKAENLDPDMRKRFVRWRFDTQLQ